jgi:hypothetical protein
LESGKLAGHFGHCEQFLFVDVDPNTRQVLIKPLLPLPIMRAGYFPSGLPSMAPTL